MLQAAVRGDKSSKATRQGTGAYSSQEEEEEAKPDLQAMQGMETQHHGPTSELMKARTFLDRLLEEVKIFHERFSFQNWRVDRLRDWRDDLVKDVENQYQVCNAMVLLSPKTMYIRNNTDVLIESDEEDRVARKKEYPQRILHAGTGATHHVP